MNLRFILVFKDFCDLNSMNYESIKSLVPRRKLYALAEGLHPVNAVEWYNDTEDFFKPEEIIQWAKVCQDLGITEYNAIVDIAPTLILNEGVTPLIGKDPAEILDSGNNIEISGLLTTAPEIAYKTAINPDCRIIYLDNNFKPYLNIYDPQIGDIDPNKHVKRERYWAFQGDIFMRPDDTTLIRAGAGHLIKDVNPYSNEAICILPELLSERGIDLEITYRTISMYEALKKAGIQDFGIPDLEFPDHIPVL